MGLELSQLAELNSPLSLLLSFVVLALVPFLLLGMTSFIKMSVVLGILRNALGLQQVPSAAVSTLLALALTIYVMAPVGEAVFSIVEKELEGKTQVELTELYAISVKAGSPLMEFLRKNTRGQERAFFASEELEDADCEAARTCSLKGETIFTLVPAFIISQLREAFIVGFSLFLPFLVIDLVVANLLLGLGMMMVSPIMISLPFKVILFVLCDGWFLLTTSLVSGYL